MREKRRREEGEREEDSVGVPPREGEGFTLGEGLGDREMEQGGSVGEGEGVPPIHGGLEVDRGEEKRWRRRWRCCPGRARARG